MSAPVLVITGGFGALGQALARRAAAEGAALSLVDRGETPAWARELAGEPLLLDGVDLADPLAAQESVRRTLDRFGRVDALLNVAGGFRWQTLREGELSAWEDLYRMNVMTAATACRAILPAMIAAEHGAIVNVGANASARAGAGMGAYAAAKSGVARLTESLAEEVKDSGVRVNAVLPSIIDTPTNRADMPGADWSAWVTPDDLAAVMLFLASDAARAINGALIPVLGRL